MEMFKNPFRPGAGQLPPYLAGRQKEKDEFVALLSQDPILKNLVLTGLRGVGKTVLLESLKPIAVENGWFWAGTDLSESASISEHSLSIRILTDISALVSSFTVQEFEKNSIGFIKQTEKTELKLNYTTLLGIYTSTPGLESDKLKRVLELVWEVIKSRVKGLVLAYDEAQILKDKAAEKQYPLSLLLEVIQYLQRKNIPIFLVLTGLPTLYPNLVEARTYAERMFQIIILDKLNREESTKAILKPIEDEKCPVRFSSELINEIISYSDGYPYFIQFFCKEVFDNVLQQVKAGIEKFSVDIEVIVRKLDTDFYSGRWSRVTDRQKDLLLSIASLPNANNEFTIKDVVTATASSSKPFKTAYLNNMFSKLIEIGLLFKNRRSKYSFAVPLLADYINRQRLNDNDTDFDLQF